VACTEDGLATIIRRTDTALTIAKRVDALSGGAKKQNTRHQARKRVR
jgi:hypothetical protein